MGTVAPHAILTQVLHALNGKKDECLLYNFHVCDTFVVIALKQSKLRTIALQIAIELLWCLLCRLSSLAYSICPSWVCFSIENQSSCTLQTRVRLDILARFFALKTSWSWLRTNLKPWHKYEFFQNGYFQISWLWGFVLKDHCQHTLERHTHTQIRKILHSSNFTAAKCRTWPNHCVRSPCFENTIAEKAPVVRNLMACWLRSTSHETQ